MVLTANVHTLAISSLEYIPETKMLISSSADKTIKFLNITSALIYRTVNTENSTVLSLLKHPTMNFVFGITDKSLVVLNVNSLKFSTLYSQENSNPFISLDIIENSSLVAIGTCFKQIRVIDANTKAD